MRSKLFVPGSRPALFSKALGSGADAVCFDLEDAVLPSRKAEARHNMQAFLQANPATDRAIMVRMNNSRSPFFAEDLSAIAWAGLAIVNLPKVDDPSQVEQVSAALSKLEKKRSIARSIAILPTIESPRGLRQAHAIAAADARVMGLQLGLIDLFEPLGISQKDPFAGRMIRLQLRLAAAEAALPCFDGAFPDFADMDGFAAQAELARGLGFAGKSCIHPSQIAAANRIFSPSAEEIAMAHQTVSAAHQASLEGLGAFALGGRMIDEPAVRRAKEIIHLADHLQKGNVEP
jgi:citrate lyase subunit beta/citryl-CoA lyase